jgi:hypothetical protein
MSLKTILIHSYFGVVLIVTTFQEINNQELRNGESFHSLLKDFEISTKSHLISNLLLVFVLKFVGNTSQIIEFSFNHFVFFDLDISL